MRIDIDFIQNDMTLDVAFQESEQHIDYEFNEVIEVDKNHEVYMGEYDVTPNIEQQVLETANKVLVENVTIKKIPFFEVGNTSGGTTVYIGKEV